MKLTAKLLRKSPQVYWLSGFIFLYITTQRPAWKLCLTLTQLSAVRQGGCVILKCNTSHWLKFGHMSRTMPCTVENAIFKHMDMCPLTPEENGKLLDIDVQEKTIPWWQQDGVRISGLTACPPELQQREPLPTPFLHKLSWFLVGSSLAWLTCPKLEATYGEFVTWTPWTMVENGLFPNMGGKTLA